MTKTARSNKAYEFCKANIDRPETPAYVRKQMEQWMDIYDGNDPDYMVSMRKVKQLYTVLKFLNMPKGLRAGESLYSCTTGYQWFFYIATLCTVRRDDPRKRKYETCVLEIARKNFKTYTISTIFILLFLTEPRFSKFYSVAPDGTLSREVREAISETLKSSPDAYTFKGEARWKILRDSITFKPFSTTYIPLSYSTSRMDGRLPNAFCADEVGALPSSYAIEAMRSGQLNILNKLGFIISTKYPTVDNPFEDEVSYSKKVLDGVIDDPTRFSLLYEPDNVKGWETDDLVLRQANPVSLEIPEIWEDLKQKRAYAVAVESARENFLTKHCNIVYQAEAETYVNLADVQACKVSHIDWAGRDVYLGLDLSMTNDNTSVSVVSMDDDGTVLADSLAFIPADRIDEKNAAEKIDYREFIRAGKCIACGDRVIDYKAVEDWILGVEERYGVHVMAVGYDRWNALSTAQKLDEAGLNAVEIRQHSSVLHPPTKWLREKILKGEFAYTPNKLLEINFQNARCTYDTNMNMFVHKKKSRGKVDMVVSLINAMFLLQQDYVLGDGGPGIQVI